MVASSSGAIRARYLSRMQFGKAPVRMQLAACAFGQARSASVPVFAFALRGKAWSCGFVSVEIRSTQ